MTRTLELSRLSVPFGSEPGLGDIDLTVEAGEAVAIVGVSGAGKSSLLRAVSGQLPVTAGCIRVRGRDVTRLPPGSRDVVLLTQRPLLFPHLSVGENVAFPLKVRGIGRPEVERRVTEALAAVQLDGFVHRRPHTLSGGQAHRVAVARAVVARPPVLLLDEPLAGLDPALRGEVREAILRIQAEYQPALLLVTHDLGEAGDMAHRVGVLLDGRLAQIDTPEGLFRRPATLPVARFLGLSNEVHGRVDPTGQVVLAGWRLGGPTRLEGGARGAILVFGRQAVHVGAPGPGRVPATVTRVRHDPEGITVTVCVTPRPGPEFRVDRHESVLHGLADPGCAPRPDSAVGIRILMEHVHVFDAP